jgi:IS1 family transposase
MHAKQLLEVIQDCKIRIEYEEHVPLYKRYQEITTGTELNPQFGLISRTTTAEEEQNSHNRNRKLRIKRTLFFCLLLIFFLRYEGFAVLRS